LLFVVTGEDNTGLYSLSYNWLIGCHKTVRVTPVFPSLAWDWRFVASNPKLFYFLFSSTITTSRFSLRFLSPSPSPSPSTCRRFPLLLSLNQFRFSICDLLFLFFGSFDAGFHLNVYPLSDFKTKDYFNFAWI